MKKSTALASVAALALAFAMQPAAAQSTSGSSTHGGSSVHGGSSIVLADHSMRSSKLIGSPVVNEEGQSVGKLVDVLVKDGSAEPVVVLSVGEFTGEGSKLVAAPLSHIKIQKSDVMMPGATKQALTVMPGYNFLGLQGGGG